MIDFLARILFPSQPVWLRIKKLKTILAVIMFSLLFGLVVAGFMLAAANKR